MFKRMRRAIKFWYQRRTRGWDDSELWSLDHTIAKFIEPRIYAFKRRTYGYPGGSSENEWDEILSQIARSFQLAARGHWDLSIEETADAKAGLHLFAEHFFNLWQ